MSLDGVGGLPRQLGRGERRIEPLEAAISGKFCINVAQSGCLCMIQADVLGSSGHVAQSDDWASFTSQATQVE